jgi:hypothetical protein
VYVLAVLSAPVLALFDAPEAFVPDQSPLAEHVAPVLFATAHDNVEELPV